MSGTAARQTTSAREARELVVTTFTGDPLSRPTVLWSEVWDTGSPLGLGHPFRWVLQRTGDSVRIRKLGTGATPLVTNPMREIPLADLTLNAPIALDTDGEGLASKAPLWILIQPVRDTLKPTGTWKPQAIPPDLMGELENRNALRNSSLGVGAVLLVAWLALWALSGGKTDSQELVPPQYAKVLLSPALKSRVEKKKASVEKEHARANNVVQAFKSQAVQKTAKSLLSVGAAHALLSKSTLLDTAASKALVRQVFDSKSILGQTGAPGMGALDPKGGNTTFIGLGKGTGRAGYGSGGGPQIAGQGDTMLSLSSGVTTDSKGLTRDEVGKVIRENIREVRFCYENALSRNPTIEGKLVVSFTIKATGAVGTERTKESSGDPELDQCILRHLTVWRFPKPRGGTDVGVTYPFIFKSLGG